MTIAPIPPEPFNYKSWKSWLIKIIIPVGILVLMIYFLLPTTIDSIGNCTNVQCDWSLGK